MAAAEERCCDIVLAQGDGWTFAERGDRTDRREMSRSSCTHPPLSPDWERHSPRNDDSIVIELRWRHVSVVLPVTRAHEVEAVVAEVGSSPQDGRVLKVPHHGSRTFQQPDVLPPAPETRTVAVVSGEEATPPAIQRPWRWTAMRRSVPRFSGSDRDGAVTVETDGERLEVRDLHEAARRTFASADPIPFHLPIQRASVSRNRRPEPAIRASMSG